MKSAFTLRTMAIHRLKGIPVITVSQYCLVGRVGSCRTFHQSITMAFNYRPLISPSKQFRIATLLPGPENSIVRCTLEHSSLQSQAQYEALSYVWGSSTETKIISLNSHHVVVTQTLESALRHLRSDNCERKLWVDAICINQQDVTEKGHQVTQMRRIYQDANRVVVLLGESSENSDIAVDTLAKLSYLSSELLEQAIDGALTPRRDALLFAELRVLLTDSMTAWLWRYAWIVGDKRATIRRYHRSNLLLFGEKRWTSMKVFMHRPWWRRVWIIQEIFLAHEAVFICGKKMVSAESMFAGLENYASFALSGTVEENNDVEIATGVTVVSALLDFIRKYHSAATKPTLLFLLDHFHQSLATDPRDKVFGLLGMAASGDVDDNVADYELSIEMVYSRLVQATIRRTTRLDILSFSSYPKYLPGLPSWSPEWTSSVPGLLRHDLPKRIATLGSRARKKQPLIN